MHKASNIIDGKASTQCVRGIAVKLPMLAHINEKHVLSLIRLKKDVDSFSSLNLGRLARKGREPLFVPCPTKFACDGHEVSWDELTQPGKASLAEETQIRIYHARICETKTRFQDRESDG